MNGQVSGKIRALANGQQVTVRSRDGWYVVEDVRTGEALTGGLAREAMAWAHVDAGDES